MVYPIIHGMNAGDLISAWIAWKSGNTGERYTQKALAIEAGFSEQELSQYINNKVKPGTKRIGEIATALGITVSQFWASPDSFSQHTPVAKGEDSMTNISHEDVVRAKLMKMICGMPNEDLREVFGYVEAMKARRSSLQKDRTSGAG